MLMPSARFACFATATALITLAGCSVADAESSASKHLGVGAEAPAYAVPLTADGRALLWVRNHKKPFARPANQAPQALDAKASTLVMGNGNRLPRLAFDDMRLHVEWLSPPGGKGQGAGNSGLYIQNRYEMQILNNGPDMKLGKRNAGALYRTKAPDVNASRGAGKWQAYDVIFHAARFNDEGKKIKDARLTAYWNGQLIHDDVQLPPGTGMGRRRGENPIHPWHNRLVAPFLLQDHGSGAEGPVRFRNVWIAATDGGEATYEHGAWQSVIDPSMKPDVAGFDLTDNVLRVEPVGDGLFNWSRGVAGNAYDDFELRYEVKLDNGVQGGLVVRSGEAPTARAKKGYYIVASSEDLGAIGESHGRGWLDPLSVHPQARQAYKAGQWNDVRVVAKGPVIRTYVNGTPAAAIMDGVHTEGRIVIPQATGADGAVHFRHIKIRPLVKQQAE
jgi:hypothetical protein